MSNWFARIFLDKKHSADMLIEERNQTTLGQFFDLQDEIKDKNPGNDRRSQGQLKRYEKAEARRLGQQEKTNVSLRWTIDKARGTRQT